MQICDQFHYVDLNYAIYVCLLNDVMNLKYAFFPRNGSIAPASTSSDAHNFLLLSSEC
jgi:hypothetical protein